MSRVSSQALTEGVRLEFLALAAEDRGEGRRRSLASYLALFPGHERELASAWLGLEGDQGAPASEAGPDERHVGPYRLIDELGRGGQAVVWLAEDTRVERLVALKTVPRAPLFGELAPRLEREAEALARLEHPGLGAIHDLGVDEGVAWIAMRLERGRTLAERIASGDAARRPAREVLGWIEAAARALHAAHVGGFLHRDVKPSNLMVRDDGHVVVLDFGIATSDSSPVALTLTGRSVGTPGYMAPESLSTDVGTVDRRLDVWALGVTLHEALSGGRPFAAATQDGEARRALRDEPDALPTARTAGVRRRDLERLLATALAKDPELRYSTAEALADDLGRLRRGEPLLARRSRPLRRLVRLAQRRPALVAALGALIVVAIAALALFARSERQLRDFRRLADLETARDLLAARDTLFPIAPAKVALMQRWLERTDALVGREPVHQATLASLPAPGRNPWAEEDETSARWMRSQLEDLLVVVDALRELRAFVVPQLELASKLERFPAEEHAAAWAAAAARVASDERFTGFALAPQLGLLPLGPDATSGLEEFAHLPSGAPAQRDEETGRLTLTAKTGVVLVLVPTGATVVGASLPGEGLAHPDPSCGPWDGPPQQLHLDPFLVSKFELTQGQWVARGLENPSYLTGESRWIEGSAALHPVESVSNEDGGAVLRRMGLELPTEAQWEHAARAGSSTPWSFGGDVTAHGRFGNIADGTVGPLNDELGWALTDEVDDGHVGHAPVGSFQPNSWGLHDVHGNVFEMTRSTFEDWREHAPADGEGETARKYELLVFRGGGYDNPSLASRSSHRGAAPARAAAAAIGLRPVLRYRP